MRSAGMSRLLALARWFVYMVEPPRVPGRQQPAAIHYYGAEQ